MSIAAWTEGRITPLNAGDKPIRNPYVVLREEFDDWAVLFNPDTGRGYGLNPTGVCVWKLLDGGHTISALVTALQRYALDVSEEAAEHLCAFIELLAQYGLAICEPERTREYGEHRRPCPACGPESVPASVRCIYKPPEVINLSGAMRAAGTCYTCSNTGSQAVSGCTDGHLAVWGCVYGYSATYGSSCTAGDGLTDCQSGVYASCDCLSNGAYAGGHCNSGIATYH